MVSGDLEAASLRRLQMFVLRSRVGLQALTESRLLLGLGGRQAGAALADAGLPCPPAPMTAAASTQASVIGLEADRYIVAVDQHTVPDLWKRLA